MTHSNGRLCSAEFHVSNDRVHGIERIEPLDMGTENPFVCF